MGASEIFGHIFGPTLALLAMAITFLVYEYSRPEIAYYRLEGSGSVSDRCVRFFITSFERIAVNEPFAVVIHLHRSDSLRARVRAVDVKAGPWLSGFLPTADGNGLQVHFIGMPAGGVFLVEVHPKGERNLIHVLGLDAVERIDDAKEADERGFRSDRVRVCPRGFRRLDHSFRGPFTRFYVQVFLGLVFGFSAYFLLAELSHRVFPDLPDSVSPRWLEYVLLLPIAGMSMLYYMPRRGTSANDGIGREFACAYRHAVRWAVESEGPKEGPKEGP